MTSTCASTGVTIRDNTPGLSETSNPHFHVLSYAINPMSTFEWQCRFESFVIPKSNIGMHDIASLLINIHPFSQENGLKLRVGWTYFHQVCMDVKTLYPSPHSVFYAFCYRLIQYELIWWSWMYIDSMAHARDILSRYIKNLSQDHPYWVVPLKILQYIILHSITSDLHMQSNPVQIILPSINWNSLDIT